MGPVALTRKNALFAGHDDGAQNWAILASLIRRPANSMGINPQAYLADVLTRLVPISGRTIAWTNSPRGRGQKAARQQLQRAAYELSSLVSTLEHRAF